MMNMFYCQKKERKRPRLIRAIDEKEETESTMSLTDWLLSPTLQDQNKTGLRGTSIFAPSIWPDEEFDLDETTVESQFGFAFLPDPVTIYADRQTVWNILMDFDSYPEWNPLHRNITILEPKDESGNIQFRMIVKTFGTVTREVLYLDEERHIFLIGKKGMGFRCQWLTDGENSNETSSQRQVTVFHTYDHLSFPLPCLRRRIENYFRHMHEALKQRAEQRT